MSQDRGLPINLDSERFVLGSILLDAGEFFVQAIAKLTADDFSLQKHSRIFRRMNDLYERGEHIDRVTVANELMKHGELQSIDGLAYLVSLDDGLPQAINLDSYLQIVKDKSTLRLIIHASQDMMNRCLLAEEEPSAIIAAANETLLKLGQSQVKGGLQSTNQIIQGFEGGINAFMDPSKRLRGIQTGFSKLDELTNGLHPGDLVIIAARPSHGKSAICLNIAQHVAEHEQQRVAIFSLEMSKESLITRLMCARARVDSYRYRAGYLSGEERRKLMESISAISEASIFIDDTASVSIMDLNAKLRRLESEHGKLGLVIVDYLQLMATKKAGSRNEEVSALSRGLKLLAKEMQVPIIALSQLSRSVEQRGGDHRPQLSDLRDSGALEQDADVVGFLYRAELYSKDREDLRGLAELIIAKQRSGPLGTCNLVFLHGPTKFETAAYERPEGDGYGTES